MPNKNILVIAGTIDARLIIKELVQRGHNVTATVASEFGGELLKEEGGLKVFEGKLNSEGMAALISECSAKCVIDASHPFAREASLNAMEACRISGAKYIRFERKSTNISDSSVIWTRDFDEAAELLANMEGKILLTTGSNNLHQFTKRLTDFKERVYIRVLPDSNVLAKCEVAGFSAKNIIAMQGPFSEDMNVEMLKHCKASILVTKDSGDAGGVAEKLAAADRMGASVIIIKRPEVSYGLYVSSVEEAVGMAERCMG